ncbi:MAG: sigma 54-interacting transcriptional regulator [Syntrophobacteraceae bacterium]
MAYDRKHILVVECGMSIKEHIWTVLKEEGYRITIITDVIKALQAIDSQKYDVLFINFEISLMRNEELLQAAIQTGSDIPVIIASDNGMDSSMEKAKRAGAFNYLHGPIGLDSVLPAIRQALEERCVRQTDILFPQDTGHGFRGIITKSPKMLQMLQLIARLSDVDSTVLITGETGVGKELVARAIHFTGARKTRPFVAINCGALTETLLESELFGHEKGSFTGAYRSKPGKFECAHKGTLFLDEIGEITPAMQVKLLRALQEKKVEKVGGTHPIDVDVRVISATNQNIKEKINDHDFRIDLFYRLNVIPIHVPPLRERPEDIPLLMKHFINMHNENLNRNIEEVAPRALKQLMDYDWPGNVRELENIVERAFITCDKHVIDQFPIPKQSEGLPPSSPMDARMAVNADVPFSVARARLLKNFERAYLQEALGQCEGNVTRTAQKTGINPRTLWRKLKEHGLDPMGFKARRAT